MLRRYLTRHSVGQQGTQGTLTSGIMLSPSSASLFSLLNPSIRSSRLTADRWTRSGRVRGQARCGGRAGHAGHASHSCRGVVPASGQVTRHSICKETKMNLGFFSKLFGEYRGYYHDDWHKIRVLEDVQYSEIIIRLQMVKICMSGLLLFKESDLNKALAKHANL